MKSANFQTFSQHSSSQDSLKRLDSLRSEISEAGLTGFLVPHSDVYNSNSITPKDERLAWLTGFTGSAGFCIVLMKTAGIFVDSRYTVQAKLQTDPVFEKLDWPNVNLGDWLERHAYDGEKIGFDPWLHTLAEIDEMSQALYKSRIELVPCDNLVDRIWLDRPDPPKAPAFAYPVNYAGRTADEKLAQIAKILLDHEEAATIITLPENIAWLLNIRGKDVKHVPLVHCFGILYQDEKLDLFIEPEKALNLKDHLPEKVNISEPCEFAATISELSSPVRIDPKSFPFAAFSILQNSKIEVIKSPDLIALPKACKNPIEIKNTRVAHGRDAAAMCEFLAWLEKQPPNYLTEIDVVIALERFRSENNELLDISFDTISASGPNAALPHYRVTYETNRSISSPEILLIDSGGQYLDGTTDVTRTIAIGEQSKEIREAFTRVLKGMIAISVMKFPRGTTGQEIDSHARSALWTVGHDFGHGTGHGVGHFLNVHEGPQRLSRAPGPAFEKGMIISNEPGFYKEGLFGIRTENLLLVKGAEFSHTSEFLEFETLTFVPIDKTMIVKSLLSKIEVDWINTYHKLCFDKNARYVKPTTKKWLSTVTQPI